MEYTSMYPGLARAASVHVRENLSIIDSRRRARLVERAIRHVAEDEYTLPGFVARVDAYLFKLGPTQMYRAMVLGRGPARPVAPGCTVYRTRIGTWDVVNAVTQYIDWHCA